MKRLDNSKKLTLIKVTHTTIWAVFVAAIFYVLFAGIFDRVNLLTWICIGLVFVECIVLLIFKWKCPFTLLGQKYTSNHEVGFDIFLPAWLAKHNKVIFGVLFIFGLALVLWRVLLE